MSSSTREGQTETEETWQAYYSERAQREYYFHPKTKIVTWILPDGENHDVHGGSIQHPAMEAHDTHRNEIPRGFVVVDTRHQRNTTTNDPKLLSGQALTVVMLLVSAIVTGVSWGLYGVDSETTEIRGRICVDNQHEMLDSPIALSMRTEDAFIANELLDLENLDHAEALISIDALTDDTPHGYESLAGIFDQGFEILPSSYDFDAARPDDDHRLCLHHGIEICDAAEVSKSDSPRNLDESAHQTHLESQSELDSSENDEENGASCISDLNSIPNKVDEPADNDPTEVTIVHVRRRACSIPFAHIISRVCRLEAKDQPLFNVEALVDALVML